ncbi:hypothetical protein NUACC21_21680 [Scytonema sp. NUACC21]
MPLLSVALILSVLNVAEQALSAQKLGSDGPEVANIQSCLKKLGYFNSQVTGKFANRTQEAVIRFQRANGLPAVGVVGKQTQQLLRSQCQSRVNGGSVNGNLRRGTTSASVRRLQQDLQRLGYFNSDITGYFGSETERAVYNFQQSYGIRPDGIVGTRTQEAIRASLNQPNYPPIQAENYPPILPEYPPPFGNNGMGGGDSNTSYALRPGDSGQEVRQLQEDLQQLGYFNANPTGYYGSTTREAVERFQQNYRIRSSGVADYQTLDTISNILAQSNSGDSNCAANRGEICLGERSQRVEMVQRRLQDLGFFRGNTTGYYGSASRDAVVQFQRNRGLEPHGFVDFQTWQALGLSYPGYPNGNPTGSNPGRENRYVVVVPIRNYDTLNRVRQYVPNAFQADSRLGAYVNAGQYNSRSEAEKQSDFLRSQGIDSRVEYF